MTPAPALSRRIAALRRRFAAAVRVDWGASARVFTIARDKGIDAPRRERHPDTIRKIRRWCPRAPRMSQAIAALPVE